MFLIMFKTGHALLLPGGRVSSARNGREVSAQKSHSGMASWPQTRHSHEHEQAQVRAQSRIGHVREVSATTFNPRPWTRQHTVRSRHSISALTARKQASALDTTSPQTVRVRELATGTIMVSPETFRVSKQATNYPRSSISEAFAQTLNFPVHIKPIPPYVQL